MNPVVKRGWDESSLEGMVLLGLEGPSGTRGGSARRDSQDCSQQPSVCPVPAGTADVVLWSILISPGEAFTELLSTGKWSCSTHPALQRRRMGGGTARPWLSPTEALPSISDS